MALKEELEIQGIWLFKWRSYLPLLIAPVLIAALRSSKNLEGIAGNGYQFFYGAFCIALSFAGLAIRFITVGYVSDGSSGRNTKDQRAEVLNTTGMYSVVRHPLYLGNFVISLGIALFVQVWWFVFIIALIFWLYYERIMFAEEEFLRNKYARPYLEWAGKTPAFLLNLRHWQRSRLPFSFRYALRREYSALFGIIASFILLDVGRSLFARDNFELKLIWVTSFFAGMIVFLVMRILRKKTKVFHVERRPGSGASASGRI